MPLKPERIRADTAAAILGVEVRTVQDLAKRGKLPGAAKVGRVWTFNEATLRRWLAEQEAWNAQAGERAEQAARAAKHRSGEPYRTQRHSAKAFEEAMAKVREEAKRRIREGDVGRKKR